MTNRYTVRAKASAIFTPSAPIHQLALFRGREEQIRMVFEAVNQFGQHAIIYGERGVGKTSLASVIGEILEDAQIANIKLSHVNCDVGDSFGSLWQKVFRNLTVTESRLVRDDKAAQRSLAFPENLAEWLGDQVTPDEIRRVARLAQGHLIAILDEFDQLKRPSEIAGLMANTIKTLADQRAAVTLVLVGVADSVDELVAEHASIDRNLVQVRIPRMSAEEVGLIVRGGLQELGMTIEDDALACVQALVQGLPSPAHRIGLQCAYMLGDSDQTRCTKEHVSKALEQVISQLPETLLHDWGTATQSPRREALFKRVLVACALTRRNELGWFSPADVREPFRAVTQKDYEIAGYSQHLHLLATGRGEVLERTGGPRRYSFRFRNPLFQTFVIMLGLSQGLLDESTLERFRKNLPG